MKNLKMIFKETNKSNFNGRIQENLGLIIKVF